MHIFKPFRPIFISFMKNKNFNSKSNKPRADRVGGADSNSWELMLPCAHSSVSLGHSCKVFE